MNLLTDDEIWKNDAIMAANSGYGANFETLRELTRAIEAAVLEKLTKVDVEPCAYQERQSGKKNWSNWYDCSPRTEFPESMEEVSGGIAYQWRALVPVSALAAEQYKVRELVSALHSISLASQDSGSTREGMGLYARVAIAKYGEQQ